MKLGKMNLLECSMWINVLKMFLNNVYVYLFIWKKEKC